MPDEQKFRLGMKGVLMVNGAKLDNTTDVTITLDASEADVTTRGNKGFRATVAGLKECTIEWSMLDKTNDPGVAAIRQAWLEGEPIQLHAKNGEEGEGPSGKFAITGFSRSEPLEEAIKYDVTAKLTEWEGWQ